MKNILLILTVLFLVSFSFAQETKKDDWIRVQSDNGEFSIEVPANYSYFYDKDGFLLSQNFDKYFLENMNMLNAYVDDTLLSFECYKVEKKALDIIKERDENSSKFSKEKTSSNEIKKDTYKIKQLISKKDSYFTIKQYFYSKSYIYLLVASSRKGETQTMRRFLDSLQFKPDSKSEQIKDAVVFSKLKVTPIEILEAKNVPTPTDKNVSPTPKQTDEEKKENLIIISKPLSGYTDEARKNSETGIIRLKIVFAENGWIPKIFIVNSLKYGLLRQAIFAALRIKFLPKEVTGKPMTVTKTVEYSFSIY